MGLFYEQVMRPLLFTQDAEKAHENAILWMKLLGSQNWLCRLMEQWNCFASHEPIELFGLEFPNAIGLAAGFDKNAEIIRALSALGFGHVEVGTITHQRQPGNSRPRLFRFPEHEAVINRMGFNNDGAEIVANRLSRLPRRRQRIPLGINIGKTKTTPIEEAVSDYLGSFSLLADYADYFAINVSSPNTPELRKLQGKAFLPDLLNSLMKANKDRARKMGTDPIPMLLKIAPDLSYREIDDILETLIDTGMSGVIATNTTVQRAGEMVGIEQHGGLSGRPLHRMSCQVVNYIHKATEGKVPIIGVGGISTPRTAGEMMDAGASLIQIYTGMVYKGPFVPRMLARSLRWRNEEWV